MNSEPKDLVTFCQTDKRYQLLCQDEGFWEEYFLKHGRTPPPRINVGQYYLDEFMYINEADKWLNNLRFWYYIQPYDVGIGVYLPTRNVFIPARSGDEENRIVYESLYPEFGDDLVLGLQLDEEDENNFIEFLTELRSYLYRSDDVMEDAYIGIMINDDGTYKIEFGNISRGYQVTMSKEQVRILISRLLTYGAKFTLPGTEVPIELNDF